MPNQFHWSQLEQPAQQGNPPEQAAPQPQTGTAPHPPGHWWLEPNTQIEPSVVPLQHPDDFDDDQDYTPKTMGPVLLEPPKTPVDISKTKLSKIFKYRAPPPDADFPSDSSAPPKPVESFQKLSTFFESIKLRVPEFVLPVVEKEPEVLVGIEVEIENLNPVVPSNSPLNGSSTASYIDVLFRNVWNKTVDSSLRDNGYEYVSRVGLKAKDAPAALHLLRTYLETYYSKAKLSYRCGTHVHIDVRDLTVEQFVNLCCLYMLFEDLFYKVSGERWKNIFCVPLRDSASSIEEIVKLVHMQKPTYKDFRDSFKPFKKYMGFNVRPAGCMDGHNQPIGTVEFRHHKGSSHPVALTYWLQYIIDIHHFAQQVTFEQLKTIIFSLNSDSKYYKLAAEVFTRLPDRYTINDLSKDMYEGSSFVKEVYLNAKG
jgi:hypothetical protein